MSDNTVSITVPLTPDALIKASEFLLNLSDVNSYSNRLTDNDSSPNTAEEVGNDATPAPSATSSQETAGAGTTPDTDTDADGVVWDERIHSGSKGKTAKGVWKKRKNLPDGLYESVMAELKGDTAPADTAPADTAPADTAPADTTTPPPPAPAPAATTTPPPPAPAPAAEVRYLVDGQGYTRDELIASGWDDDLISELRQADPEPPTPAVAADTGIKFPTLMQKIKAAKDEGTLTDEQVKSVCESHGMSSIALVSAQPQLVPTIYAELFGE